MPTKPTIASIVKVDAWWRQYLYRLKWLYLKFIDPFIQVEAWRQWMHY